MRKISVFVLVMVLAMASAAAAQPAKWGGFYLGATVGSAAGTSNATTTTVFSNTGYFATTSVPAIATAGVQTISPKGVTYGGRVGFNVQAGAFVFGVEADFSSMKQSATATSGAVYPCCAGTAFTINQTVSNTWLLTARPRIGVAFGPVLIFGTGGLAVTDVAYNQTFSDTFATASESAGGKETRKGWTAGGGIEVQFAKRFSVRGEYLYANFGSLTPMTSTNFTAFTPPIPFTANPFTSNASLTSRIVRFGFNVRF